ncbi:MAG: dihydropteroate synthase [bacterium]
MTQPDHYGLSLDGLALPARLLPRHYRATSLIIRGREFTWGARTYVMGIINATPDSFSGDGLGSDIEAAVALARQMEADGADWLDIGGESSRPGAEELDPAEELRRVVPVIEAVREVTSLPISVDTYHASVARAGIAAGADAVNDIWGLRQDPAMAGVVADTGSVLIAMHNQRGRPGTEDVTGAIGAGFEATLRIAAEHGIPEDRIILDPGFGFGWAPEQNLAIIRNLSSLWAARFPYPFLLGTSRKSTIGHVLGGAPVDQRIEGTAATVALSIASGADIVRVHDVREMARVAQVADAVVDRGPLAPVSHSVVIALGSNLGDRAGNLRAAVAALEARNIRVTGRSSVWETGPVPADQPAFLNAVVTAETTRSAQSLLAALKEIEHALGRRPERRWGPRPIDLDILFFGRERIDTPELTIPHPLILERSFVLAPLSEIVPGDLPVLKTSAQNALAKIGTDGLRRYGAF